MKGKKPDNRAKSQKGKTKKTKGAQDHIQSQKAQGNESERKGAKTHILPGTQQDEVIRPRMKKGTVWALLIVILLIAIVLRLWGVKFGLPKIYYIDSTKIVKRSKLIANNLIHGKLDIDPQLYQYPTFLTNLLAYEYVVYGFAYGIITSRTGRHKTMREAIDYLFKNSDPAYIYDPYPTVFYLIARLNNAVAGILTVLLCFFLSKLAFQDDDRVGLIAALFLAVMFIHTKHSKYPMPDVMMGFWTAFAMFYLIKIIKRGKLRDFILAGLFIGFGISTKYIPVFLIPIYGINTVYVWIKNKDKGRLARNIIVFALIGSLMIPAGFLIGTPMFVTKHREFSGSLFKEHKGLGSADKGGKYGSTQTCFFDYFFNNVPSWFEPYTYNSLWGAMGVPLLIVVCMAFLYFIFLGFYKDTPDKIIFWDFIIFITVIYLFFAGKGKNRIIRYFVLSVPFYAIIAAKFLVDICDKIPWSWAKAKRGVLMGSVAVLITIPTTIRTIQYDNLMTLTNTRITAGEWFEKNIPYGKKVFMPILYPPCVSRLKYDTNFYRGQAKTANLWPVRLDDLKRADFDYIVLSSFDYRMAYSEEAMRDYPTGTMAMLEFYHEAEEKAEWVKVFDSYIEDGTEWVSIYKNDSRRRPGPVIKIFKIRR